MLLFRDRNLPLGSFANNGSALRLSTNDAELTVSMVALINEPHDFNVGRRHLVLPVAELITSRFLTTTV